MSCGNLVEQLVEIEDGGDFASELEERRQRLDGRRRRVATARWSEVFGHKRPVTEAMHGPASII